MSPRPALHIQWLAALVALCAGATALAHDARPLSIVIVEQSNHIYRAVVRTPPTIESQNRPRIVWPGRCRLGESAPADGAPASGILVNCPGGIATQAITIEYPFFNPSITTLIRLQAIDGFPVTAVLAPDVLEWIVPAEPTFASVAGDYLLLGIRHIWGGIDHLLFVAGLLLLARGPRKIVLAVTGFTIAHSFTLSLAALDLVRLPVAPVEAMIALSILFLAVEIARDDPKSFSRRFPIALSFVFGLLHGFGFASALGEIGLPRSELTAGLLFFNLGVEAGQLAFIAIIAALVLASRFLAARIGAGTRIAPGRLGIVGAYCLGIPAALWFFERSAAAFNLFG